MGAPNVVINVGLLMIKEVTYKGSFRYGASFFFFSCRLVGLSIIYSPVTTPWLSPWSRVEKSILSLLSLIGEIIQSTAYVLRFNRALSRFAFRDAITAFQATQNGKSDDGKGVIKAIISGPE